MAYVSHQIALAPSAQLKARLLYLNADWSNSDCTHGHNKTNIGKVQCCPYITIFKPKWTIKPSNYWYFGMSKKKKNPTKVTTVQCQRTVSLKKLCSVHVHTPVMKLVSDGNMFLLRCYPFLQQQNSWLVIILSSSWQCSLYDVGIHWNRGTVLGMI